MENDPQFIKQLFDSMDVGNTGHIRATDLQKGLSNGTERPFNIKACKMLIGMYDKNGSRTIDFNEFAELYGFVTGWVKAFQSADADESGEITQPELNRLLNDMGYRLSQKFYTFVGNKFHLKGDKGLDFDDFIYIILMVTLLTRMFASMDYKRENEIDLTYEQYLNTFMDITSI